MLRIAFALTLIAFIFVHSPHRSGMDFAESVAAMTRQASAQVAETMAGQGLAPALAGAVLRQTLAEALPEAASPAVAPPVPAAEPPKR